ncbi:protein DETOXIFICATION 33-like [Zingiber officinale]|uniref:protein DETOXIFICATION 33-like n=1 Tax=Zingiber officinale TaxID=94328 RepID=UPI001C4C1735|nr:protein DETOXIFICATION 33-like [Zingiber officinale]
MEEALLGNNGGRAGNAEEDMEEIRSVKQFGRAWAAENKRLWYLAGPSIFTSVCRYSLGATTQIFAGHLTTLELDAVSTENMVIAGLAFGIMMGMGSALETLCGQAYGAKQHHMLGVYMQRSWLILLAMSACLLPIYLFATPLLRFLKLDDDIAVVTGRFAIYMIPQLFAYALNFPISKFLQAQSKVMLMAAVAAVALVFHVSFTWLLVVHFRLGLAGAAVSLNLAWWIVVGCQFAYIAMGYCPGAWNGFSWSAFTGLGSFAWLSIGSAIMICLEFWYYTCLIVLVGHLKNPQIAVAAVSICNNINGWEFMVFFGFNVAISVRISNELGAGRPRAAKFSILCVVMWSLTLGIIFFSLVVAFRDVYGAPFTNSPEVVRAVSNLAVIFACTVLFNSVQPVLTGVAVGAGWQWLVAYINMGCYYLVGIPMGCLLAFYFDLGVKGMWSGMLTGVCMQTVILISITAGTNWTIEAREAGSRIRKWAGGDNETRDNYSAVTEGSERLS